MNEIKDRMEKLLAYYRSFSGQEVTFVALLEDRLARITGMTTRGPMGGARP